MAGRVLGVDIIILAHLKMNLLFQHKTKERKHKHQQESMSVCPSTAAAIKCLVLSIMWLKYVVMLHFIFFVVLSFIFSLQILKRSLLYW